MVRQAFEKFTRSPPEADRDPLIIELVLREPTSETEMRRRLSEALPDVTFEIDAVFDASSDRFHFAVFPEIDPHGQERAAFSFARELRPAVSAEEANPVLPDGLYGAAHLSDRADVESALASCETPRNSDLPFNWHHVGLRTSEAWAMTRGAGITVAVIDTGHSSHQELCGAIRELGQWNLIEGGTDAADRFSRGFVTNPGHGTLVMSVVASRGNGTADSTTDAVTGIAPEAKILPIRAIQSVIDFTQRRIPPAIVHAVDQDADVIVMALGGPTRVAATEQAVRHAVSAGTIVVCAAGNCWPAVVFPAAYARMGLCTAVAALQPDLRPWPRTGRGPEVTISTYGEHVWGAAKNDASASDTGVRASQGTTLATSITAGVAAFWVARHGGRASLLTKARAAGTTVQAMWTHCLTAGIKRPPAWDNASDLGRGVLDANRVLDASLPTGAEAIAAPHSEAEPTINVLLAHFAGRSEAAVSEVGPAMGPFAAELLWLSYRAGARRRAAGTGTESVGAYDVPSETLEAVLSEASALRDVLRPDSSS